MEHIVAEHQQLMSALGGGGVAKTSGDVIGEDFASESILQKIAELAPVLAKEADEVKELCKLTGQ